MIIKQLSRTYDKQPYLKILYKAMLSTSYFGLLRVGELTAGEHPILAKDVHIASNKRKIMFILHTSKTHGKHMRPQTIKITSVVGPKHVIRSQSCKYCPYTLLREYLRVRGTYKTDTEPFFVFSDGSPVMPVCLQKCLKSTLQAAGFQQHLYSVHSLRMGRACDLLQLGVSVETIKKIGRWRSNADFKYLK